ncbi:MAG: hypothetical protein Q8P67_08645, partial [archaeon]|nr:hypothetical protein [archaeon]
PRAQEQTWMSATWCRNQKSEVTFRLSEKKAVPRGHIFCVLRRTMFQLQLDRRCADFYFWA